MSIAPETELRVNQPVSVEEAQRLYRSSTLAERRPTDDPEKMRRMLEGADLTVTAWCNGQLVGIARTITDHCYVAYLADLAVDQHYQRQGIGKALILQTRDKLGPDCLLVLLTAPAAQEYYPKVGFDAHPSAWVMKGEQR